MADISSPAETVPAVDVRRPAVKGCGLVFSLPHSGPYLPADFVAAARYDAKHLRMTEDAFVDVLVGFETLEGVWAVRANYSRAYVDVNRHPLELDPRLIRGPLPKGTLSQSLRVRSGYGVIPRCLSGGREIHAQPISYDEAARRLTQVHLPYHRALTEALAEAKSAHGRVTLIDWHSMPSTTLKPSAEALASAKLADIVLGDLHGEACPPGLTAFVRQVFETHGFRVSLNYPFAGGYTLERYAQPHKGVEALQIELNRGLYMDEATLILSSKAERMRAAVTAVIDGLKLR